MTEFEQEEKPKENIEAPPSRLLGTLKFFYFISPLGYLFDYERHMLTRHLFREVYNGNLWLCNLYI